jgi:hypothetical protein
MPWHIVHDDPHIWTVRNIETNRILGTHTSYKAALSQLRLLYYLLNKGTIREGGALKDPRDEIYLKVSVQSYQPPSKRQHSLDGYKYDSELSTDTEAIYYDSKDKKVIIGHRGTKTAEDLVDDARIIAGNFTSKSPRLANAILKTRQVLQKYPDYTLTSTGHSLGNFVASVIGPLQTYKNSRVVGFNPGASFETFKKNLGDTLKCFLSNSEDCRKLKNQKVYSTGIDPISILGLIHPGKTEIVRAKSYLNPHALSNF